MVCPHKSTGRRMFVAIQTPPLVLREPNPTTSTCLWMLVRPSLSLSRSKRVDTLMSSLEGETLPVDDGARGVLRFPAVCASISKFYQAIFDSNFTRLKHITRVGILVKKISRSKKIKQGTPAPKSHENPGRFAQTGELAGVRIPWYF